MEMYFKEKTYEKRKQRKIWIYVNTDVYVDLLISYGNYYHS